MAATPACLVVSPDEVDFRTVRLSCGDERVLRLTNACASPISVTAASLAGSAEFRLGSAAFPLSVPAEGVVTLGVAYRPTDIGPDVAALRFSSVEPGGRLVEVGTTLLGRGATTSGTVDVFEVPAKADVLFVIDDSGSMADKQLALQQRMTELLAYANDAGVDWQLGVTTTDDDNGAGGALARFNGTAILRPTSPNFTATWNALVNRGISGSPLEMGLGPAVKAVTPPLSLTQNAGFVRQDASLGLVFLTDTVDGSPRDPARYVERLRSVKGARRANELSVSGLLPLLAASPTGLCTYEAPEDGRYLQAVSATGGIAEEICAAATQGDSYVRLGEAAFGRRATWFLTAPPAGAITVTINGATVPASQWTRSGSVVTFQRSVAPRARDVVRFAYDTQCLP
ncbi:MAG: VWA domain-containing protein [Myxococcaceae bacterium]|nr:VWA domain-containing protein [Myxococcaceae bacterium]MCA3013955.1 VWA domain-containing protein [Myxococcaceae bacterium]